jgi:hypothetical protein
MIGRRAVVGLSLLSALLLCAFAAQSASANVRTTSNNTTAFTCVKDAGKTGDFKDAHCDETGIKGKEEFKHVEIKLNETTEIEASNEKVTESTKKSEPALLTGKIALAKVKIECLKVKNKAGSTIHNVEPTSKQHTFTGTIETEFEECKVLELAKCAVKEPIIAGASIHGVEGMEGPKGEKNAMGIEFVGHKPEETFTEIEFINKGAEACSLNGKKFPVKGSVVATSGPTTESPQENKESGATLVFNKMNTLKFGPEPAEFHGIFTSTMKETGGNPIALTTTT